MRLKREGAACLFSVGNSSVKSSLCLTPILHVCYGLVHEDIHGSLVPNSHQAQLSQSDPGKSYAMCGEKNPNLFNSTFNGCAMLAGTRLGHKLRADSGRLPSPLWLHSFQKPPGVSWETHIHLTKCGGKIEWGRSLDKLSTCRNWSIWHTVGRNISKTCSLQMNQRKIQNKTTQQRQDWDLFFLTVFIMQKYPVVLGASSCIEQEFMQLPHSL